MISIVWQGDHRYNVYRSGEDIGCITISDNPFHNTHRYLNLGLTQYDPSIAKDLFSRLRKELGQPLQIMLYSKPEMCNFLTAGGFVRKRRCYELEVASSNLAISPAPTVELHTAQKGSTLYDTCCDLLYAYYSATHEAVSPLTATQEVFLPTYRKPLCVASRTASLSIMHSLNPMKSDMRLLMSEQLTFLPFLVLRRHSCMNCSRNATLSQQNVMTRILPLCS